MALIADLIRDCSRRNGVILDPFAGSGTTILAAERTGRAARAIELDPLYVDIVIRRWEQIAGCSAKHTETGLTFSETAARREIDETNSCEPQRPLVASEKRFSQCPENTRSGTANRQRRPGSSLGSRAIQKVVPKAAQISAVGETAAAAFTLDTDAGGIKAEPACIRVQPNEDRIDVLYWRWVRCFWREAMIDRIDSASQL